MKKAGGFTRDGNVSFNFLADEQSVEKDECEFKILRFSNFALDCVLVVIKSVSTSQNF